MFQKKIMIYIYSRMYICNYLLRFVLSIVWAQFSRILAILKQRCKVTNKTNEVCLKISNKKKQTHLISFKYVGKKQLLKIFNNMLRSFTKNNNNLQKLHK